MKKVVKVVAAKNNYGLLDDFKIVAAMLVIAIHTGPLTSYNTYADFLLTGIFARLAVPFFFMASGFLLFQKLTGEISQDRLIVNRYARKITWLYLASMLLYVPLNVYAGYFTLDFSLLSTLKDILFNGTLYHLWYFPALILGVYLTYFLYKKLSFTTMFVLTGLLYLIGLLGDSYFGLVEQKGLLHAIYSNLFSLFDYTRNGLFFAPLFIVLGAWTAQRSQTSRNVQSATSSALFFALAVALLFVEGSLVQQLQLPRHDSMYVFLVPAVYYLFQFLLTQKGRGGSYVRQLSTWIYILHPLSIVVVRGVAKLSGLSAVLVANSLIHFVVVTLLSILFAGIVVYFISREITKPTPKHRAWVEVNLAHLRHNLVELQKILPADCKVMAVVKADAYGHGSIPVAKSLYDAGVRHFAVAECEEGITLRKHGIEGEIIVLGYTSPSRFRDLVRYDLTQTVISADYAGSLNESRRSGKSGKFGKFGRKVNVHIKIDTGMGRLGETHANMEQIRWMYQQPHLHVTGTYSHLSVSDSHQADDMAYTRAQINRFYEVIGQLKYAGINPGTLHIQSSYGILNYPDLHCGLARPGIALYGLLSNEDDNINTQVRLRPVLSLKAKVTLVHSIKAETPIGYGRSYVPVEDSRIATVSIGYADGIPRALFEQGGNVLVRGQQANIAGNICMDQMMIDVTHIDGVQEGDTVTLIGQDGAEIITAGQVASRCNTITNEIVSGIGSRVERVYIRRSEVESTPSRHVSRQMQMCQKEKVRNNNHCSLP
ncbi:serine racemase VanT catalytic subunit [Paenibacillus sp. 481]|uniref:serine racemase VanT catalytic subunit n=1 Tax=Paenibacillus sp. 481 TaxID=2835869 RepID=UPI001E2C0E5E|nr:serine racemase VanT catalytic subunit [Paenibacillus sp. 481]UHA72677.1 serine racemase VanT catalytic subunit [Paenibacillus sp. 481]